MMEILESCTPEVEFSEEDRTDTASISLDDIQSEMAVLERFCYGPMGTFGRVRYLDFRAYSVERPWENNQQFISCIPVGIYRLSPTTYYGGDGPGGKRDYPSYKLLSVPNRTHIKIHVANIFDDLFGCIGLGTVLGFIDKRWAVLNSKRAHGGFMDEMAVKPASYLCIKNLVGKGEWNNP
jgi:hypothetical protein